jgi:hypothetical protein
VPAIVERQPRVSPIASTIVNASTNSTAEASNVDAASPAVLQLIRDPPTVKRRLLEASVIEQRSPHVQRRIL